MKQLRVIAAFALGFVVSGCAAFDGSVSRMPGNGASPVYFAAVDVTQDTQILSRAPIPIADVRVSVPKSLIVSEANRYYPAGDIVWRGEAPGDRHQQVVAIFEDALAVGTVNQGDSAQIDLEIEVERFHSLTEKARYTVGGVHSIRFVMILRDVETGQLLVEPKSVRADLKAFGGQRALDAERLGQTQRVRVVSHLTDVIQAELEQTAWQWK